MWTTTAIATSGVQSDTHAGDAVATRESVLAMTDEAETAVLKPVDPGAWPHALRASLACRSARQNSSPGLADRYFNMIDDPQYASLGDPDNNGSPLGLETMVSFMDKVATRPREVTESDISALQQAGIADADIVRLCELNAFMAYQVRLVAGLAMLSGSDA